MRPRNMRSLIVGPLMFAGAAFVAFAAAPVSAEQPPPNQPWGDITSVVAGPGLSGGAQQGDATLSVAFDGSGTASTVAHSDHNHNGVYALVGHTHDNLYAALNHSHGDLYAALNHNHDDRYWLRTENFDDRYSPLGHAHDDRYAALNHNHDDLYAALAHNHDDLYLGLGGGTLSGFLTLAAGDLTLLGDGARVVAPQLVSTAPQGTAPFDVSSSTVVPNLNADLLDGYQASDFQLAGQAGNYALLDAANAFTGANTFNAGTTFAAPLSLATGGANFTWQPVWSSTTSYSLRLVDSRLSTTRLVVDQLGRIGIGTTSPGFPLHVVGDVRANALNLGTGILSPLSYDMAASTDRTFAFTNSNGGLAHLSVEGNVSAAGYSVTTGGAAARAGSGAMTAGTTAVTVATAAVGGSSLIFVTPDASSAGCAPPPAMLYVSARTAGANFTVTVAGAAPESGSYCFSWWVVN